MYAPWTWPAVCADLCAIGVWRIWCAWTSPKSRAYRAARREVGA
jgi:hypothetical protein